MTAIILKFAPRGRFDVRTEREADGSGWLVLTHDREHVLVAQRFQHSAR